MPRNWIPTPLGKVVSLQRGFDLAKEARIPGPFRILSAGKSGETHNEAKVKGPGFAIGRATNLGKPQWSDEDFWPLNTTLFATDFHGNDPRWLFYWFENADLTGFDSGSVQPMLNRNYIAGISINLPPIEEQTAIATMLRSLDDKIAANNRAKGIALDLIKALGGKPTNTVKLSVLCERSTHSIKPETIEAKTVLHYSLPAFDLGAPAQEDPATIKSNKFSLEHPCVLLSKLNPHTPRIWSVPVINEDVPMIASSEFVVLQPTTCRQAQLFAATAQPELFHHLESLTGGTSKSHQRVRPADILTSEVPDTRTLSAEESQMLELLTLRFESLVVENQVLARTRDELLPLLMSGRITVGEAEDAANAAASES